MKLYSDIIFPYVMNLLMARPLFSEQRVAVLHDLGGEVLEIGFGTGLNLPHYPAGVRALTAIEPNPGMQRYAAKRISNSTIAVNMLGFSGESLPLEDASFDAVVSTWTLCSIADVEQALCEVRRVLRPGGRFLFLEHGLSPDPVVARWQHRLNPLQKVIGVGCHLDRDIRGLVAGSGFSRLETRNYYLPATPKFIGYMYQGIATR